MKHIRATILSRNDKNKQQMVLQACIKFKDLKDLAQFGYRINPIESPYATNKLCDEDKQYQRRIDSYRVSKIKDFIRRKIDQNRKNYSLGVIFPTAMLLAFDYDDDINVEENSFDFDYPDKFYIVDGQHRLWSMMMLYNDVETTDDESSSYIKEYLDNYSFNCTLLMNFDMWEQAQVFADVNFTQKSVSKSLYYDIYGMEYYDSIVDRQKSAMYIAHKIIESLNNNNNSALYNHIKMLGYGRGYVSQSCFADALISNISSPMGIWYINFDNYRLKGIPPYTKMVSEAMSFFNAVADSFPDLWPREGEKAPSILCKTTGIQVLIKFMGYLHSRNTVDVEKMFTSETNSIFISDKYIHFVKGYLNMFTKRQVRLFGLSSNGGMYSGTGGKGLVNKLYAELVRIVESKESEEYDEWIENNLGESELEDVYNLYCTVNYCDDYGMYEAVQDGDATVVKYAGNKDDALVLKNNKDKQDFLDILDDRYGEDLGVENLYNIKQAIEKDD